MLLGKGQAVYEAVLEGLFLKNGTDISFSKVSNYQSTLRGIPEDLRCHFHRGRNLKSPTVLDSQNLASCNLNP